MYSRLFSRRKACSHTSRASRKVSAGWPAVANCPDIELQVGYHTVTGCQQSSAGKIEACLLERGHRISDLRIVGTLGAERLARLLERGLGPLHLRLGRAHNSASAWSRFDAA